MGASELSAVALTGTPRGGIGTPTKLLYNWAKPKAAPYQRALRKLGPNARTWIDHQAAVRHTCSGMRKAGIILCPFVRSTESITTCVGPNSG